MTHDDHPEAAVFAFREERNLGVFTCRRVADGAPILYASHDADGDWQFLCGGQHEDDGDDGALVVCLEHLVARDPSLNQLADMCTSSHAERATGGASWVITDEQAGQALPLDSPMADLLDGYGVRFRPVRERKSYDEHLGYAIWFYGGREFPVMQLLWPDKAGRFPDDPACSSELRGLQPLLL